jgi:hypothetical protein
MVASALYLLFATFVIGCNGNLFHSSISGGENDTVIETNVIDINAVPANLFGSSFSEGANNTAIDVGIVDGVVSSTTLTNKILVGYQGWFAFPGDGAPINKWKHWFETEASPSVNDLTVDMYPSMDEYDAADLTDDSPFTMKDGTKAKFFSSVKPGVVRKHFEWMRDYGISGAFHMRFLTNLDIPSNKLWKTLVLRNVRDAAESTGRVFAVSYNLAGCDNQALDWIKDDWMDLVDNERIISSGRYLKHNGLPVLRIYGIGFKEVNVDDTAKLADLIQWFQSKAETKYRAFVIGGVPSRWRSGIMDARPNKDWQKIYKSLNGIHPWHVGRWTNVKQGQIYYKNIIKKDASTCVKSNQVYIPSMWPGLSWHNLKSGAVPQPPINSIPRSGGALMWDQAYQYAADINIKTIWMANFDEVDEGTAIFKVAKDKNEVPAQGDWLTLDADGKDLPRDWYLRLCGEAQKMLEGTIKLTKSIPIKP